MKLLTKDTDYAVRALIHLGQNPGEYISATAIAQAEGIPAQYLRRLLQRLIKEKILLAKEGMRGGVRLAVTADSIGLDRIAGVFQGEIQLSECMFRKKACPNRPTCVVRGRVGRITDMVIRELHTITIGSLLADMRRRS